MKTSRPAPLLMSPTTLHILNAIADGLGYDGILAQYPRYTFFDLSDAASSAVDFIDSTDATVLAPHVRRVMVGISKGYGYSAIQGICQIDVLEIANSAYAVLELQRAVTLPKKRRKRKRSTKRKRLRTSKT